MIDEHSRRSFAIRLGRLCKARDVVDVLEDLISVYPASVFLHSDNGSEFIAQFLGNFCELSNTTSMV